jgi:hypothetical protein
VLAVENTSWSEERMDPKSLGLSDASVNINVEMKIVESPSSLPEAMGSSIYSHKEDYRERGACRIWERRCVRAPVASMVIGMVPVLVIDLSREGDVRFLYLHL